MVVVLGMGREWNLVVTGRLIFSPPQSAFGAVVVDGGGRGREWSVSKLGNSFSCGGYINLLVHATGDSLRAWRKCL